MTAASCRRREVPTRATAPGGSGSPCRSRRGFSAARSARLSQNGSAVMNGLPPETVQQASHRVFPGGAEDGGDKPRRSPPCYTTRGGESLLDALVDDENVAVVLLRLERLWPFFATEVDAE